MPVIPGRPSLVQSGPSDRPVGPHRAEPRSAARPYRPRHIEDARSGNRRGPISIEGQEISFSPRQKPPGQERSRGLGYSQIVKQQTDGAQIARREAARCLAGCGGLKCFPLIAPKVPALIQAFDQLGKLPQNGSVCAASSLARDPKGADRRIQPKTPIKRRPFVKITGLRRGDQQLPIRQSTLWIKQRPDR